MQKSDAIKAASEAAQAAMTSVDVNAGRAFLWTDALDHARPDLLAQFVEAHSDAPAESLYLFSVKGDASAVPWRHVHPAQRTAVEVFRASYLALHVLVLEVAEDSDHANDGNGSNVVRMR